MAGKPLKQLLCQSHLLLSRKPYLAHHLSLILLRHIRRRQQQRCQLKIQALIGQQKPRLRHLPPRLQAHFLFNKKRFQTPRMQFGQSFLSWREECQRRMVRKQGHQDSALTRPLPPPLLPLFLSFPSLEVVSALGVPGV